MIFNVVYPYKGRTTEEEIIGWANDAIANGEVDGEIEEEPGNVFQAISLLADCGLIEVTRSDGGCAQ